MEGLASKEGQNYNYKYSKTYLELNCQWLFEILKLAFSILCIITMVLASVDDLSEGGSRAALYKATAYLQYAVTFTALVMSFSIPLFYFTRADIFLGAGPWQKVLLVYNLLMLLLLIPCLVLMAIVNYRIHNYNNIAAPRFATMRYAPPPDDLAKLLAGRTSSNAGVDFEHQSKALYRSNKGLLSCCWANLAGVIALMMTFTSHLLAIPYRKNSYNSELKYHEYFRRIGSESDDYSETTRTSMTGSRTMTGYTTSTYASTVRSNRRNKGKQAAMGKQEDRHERREMSPLTESRFETTGMTSVSHYPLSTSKNQPNKHSLGSNIKAKASQPNLVDISESELKPRQEKTQPARYSLSNSYESSPTGSATAATVESGFI